MNNIMLDLETMGKGPNAAIIAIGAVEFDLAEQQIGKKYYSTINLESSAEHGGIMDASTVLWWMDQSDLARKVFSNGLSLPDALTQFSQWAANRTEPGNLCVWGNGAAFDNVILASAYERMHLTPPWLYWNDRCYRTLKAMAPDIKIIRSGTHHNAVDDAVNQAKHLLKIINQANQSIGIAP